MTRLPRLQTGPPLRHGSFFQDALGLWRMDAGFGLKVLDVSGKDHHGTITLGGAGSDDLEWNADPPGITDLRQRGKMLLSSIGSAVNTNQDGVRLGKNINPTGNDLTLACYFIVRELGSEDARFMSCQSSSSAADHFWMLGESGGKLRSRIKVNGTTITTIAPSANITTGVWYLAMTVYNGANIKIYLNNNTAIANKTASGVVTNTSAVECALMNVGEAATSTEWGVTRATFAWCGMWDRAFSGSEIALRMNDPMGMWQPRGMTLVEMLATQAGAPAGGITRRYYDSLLVGG